MPAAQTSLPLSDYGRKMITILLEQTGVWMTSAALAKQIGISRQTVLRELPSVEQFLTENGIELTRRTGMGIQLNATEEEILRLTREQTAGGSPLSKQERVQQLLLMLYQSREPIKGYVLARELNISEKMLKSDLDQLEELLSPYEIPLCRKPGIGTWLDASPDHLRSALGAILRSELPSEDIQQLLLGRFPTGGILFQLLDGDITKGVVEELLHFDSEEAMGFTDSAFFTLSVHLILSIQALKQSEAAFSAPSDSFSPQTRRLAYALEKRFGIRFPDEQRRYLESYIKANCPNRERPGWDNAGAWQLHHCASQLIAAMEAVMDLEFSQYPALLNDLCCHLRSVLYRAEQGRRVDNPTVDLIKAQYPTLWDATRTSCDMLAENGVLPVLNDEEAAFLAMHFGAIIERESLLRLKAHAVVVCPYGMASCRFLISQLQKEFPTLQISRCGSVRDLSSQSLEEDQADVVISTIPLELDFPVIQVNPILSSQDKETLHAAIDRIKQTERRPHKNRRPKNWQGLYYAGKLSASIDELLETMVIDQIAVPASRSVLITRASQLFCPLEQDAKLVENGLLQRERMGDTYIKPLMAVLLHCKTNAVSGCRFGYLSAQPPVYENGRVICGALVLLIPDDDDKARLEIMQTISSILVEDERLIQALRNADRVKAVELLREGLASRIRNL